MTVPDPPWKQRARPCPFYSQGRCLFGEKGCNFLHDVKIKAPLTDTSATLLRGTPPSGCPTPDGPVVRIQSPRSVRSPTRTPRMNDLLDALKGVISSDDEDEYSEEERGSSSPITASDNSLTAEQHTSDARDEVESVASNSSVDALSSVHMSPSLPVPFPLHSDTGSDLSFIKDSDEFQDSGYAPSPRLMPLSPPRSSRPPSTWDLLSSPFGSPFGRAMTAPLMSPTLGVFPVSPTLTALQAPGRSMLAYHNSPRRSDAGTGDDGEETTRVGDLPGHGSLDDLDSPTAMSRPSEGSGTTRHDEGPQYPSYVLDHDDDAASPLEEQSSPFDDVSEVPNPPSSALTEDADARDHDTLAHLDDHDHLRAGEVSYVVDDAIPAYSLGSGTQSPAMILGQNDAAVPPSWDEQQDLDKHGSYSLRKLDSSKPEGTGDIAPPPAHGENEDDAEDFSFVAVYDDDEAEAFTSSATDSFSGLALVLDDMPAVPSFRPHIPIEQATSNKVPEPASKIIVDAVNSVGSVGQLVIDAAVAGESPPSASTPVDINDNDEVVLTPISDQDHSDDPAGCGARCEHRTPISSTSAGLTNSTEDRQVVPVPVSEQDSMGGPRSEDRMPVSSTSALEVLTGENVVTYPTSESTAEDSHAEETPGTIRASRVADCPSFAVVSDTPELPDDDFDEETPDTHSPYAAAHPELTSNTDRLEPEAHNVEDAPETSPPDAESTNLVSVFEDDTVYAPPCTDEETLRLPHAAEADSLDADDTIHSLYDYYSESGSDAGSDEDEPSLVEEDEDQKSLSFAAVLSSTPPKPYRFSPPVQRDAASAFASVFGEGSSSARAPVFSPPSAPISPLSSNTVSLNSPQPEVSGASASNKLSPGDATGVPPVFHSPHQTAGKAPKHLPAPVITDLPTPRSVLAFSTPTSSRRESLASIHNAEIPYSAPASRLSQLKPLRLSRILSPMSSAFSLSNVTSSSATSHHNASDSISSIPSVATSLNESISDNPLLSSHRLSLIPSHIRNTLVSQHDASPLLSPSDRPPVDDEHHHPSDSPPGYRDATSLHSASSSRSAPLVRPASWRLLPARHNRPSSLSRPHTADVLRSHSRLSISTRHGDDDDEGEEEGELETAFDETVRKRLSSSPMTAPITRPSSALSHAIHSSPSSSRPASVIVTNTAIRELLPKRLSTAPPTAPITRPSSALSRSSNGPLSPIAPLTAPATRASSPMSRFLNSPRSARPLSMASVAPRPTLMFAIASDDPQAVRAVLANGEVGPNDQIGPQSALEFALTTGSLTNRTEIVKTLLEYGAEPPSKAEQQRTADPTASSGQSPPPAASSILDSLDPATRYYVQKAGDENTRRNSALIHRSFFRPLTRVRYDLIGQDRALEQLFRVLSMHSQQFSVAPVVVLLCGPSGHGKTYLAQKFGSLLKVPSITVNMTTLRNAQDLWQAYSTDPDSTASNHTLADFLLENEGKRCVVLLDEIEKTQDDKALWALHMPWEMGRCAFEAGRRHVDVRNVIWLATSNIGQELIFEHHSSRREQEFSMTREEYLDLMASLRPQVSGRLGTSLLSRVTTVLPFVPFTEEERMAIAGEAALHVGGDMARSLPPETMRHIVKQAAGAGYIPSEGARSLYRDVAVRLMDAL